MESNKKLSLEPYKGTRDFYPQDQFIQNYIFSVWRKVVQKFGYLEYNASILEETELYKAKSGEEIVNEQTYTFTDRGGRNVTIRPEMTPTVARLVAQKRKELSFPLRWFSIPNLFRYERPQRGRLREHWQLNVDMFGVDSVAADVELVQVAHEVMKEFGAQDDQYVIRLNNRKFLNFLLGNFLNLTDEQTYKISKLLDRMHKISGEEFKTLAKEILKDSTRVESFVAITKAKNLGELPPELVRHESVQELIAFTERLKALGISNTSFEVSLVRGFDYYTGIVFEVFDTDPANPRALFGGGRYDDLVGIFGVEKVPGVGFGMGDVTVRDFLETHGLLPPYQSPVNLYICKMGQEHLEYASGLAGELRKKGLNVAVDLTDRKVAAQVKTADRESIPYVLVVGDEEVKSDTFKLKYLKESREEEVKRQDLASRLKG